MQLDNFLDPAVSGEDTSLEPDRRAAELMGRVAVEFVTRLHTARRTEARSQRSPRPPGIPKALLDPPQSAPTDFRFLLKEVAAASSYGANPLSPYDFAHIPSGGLFTSVVAEFVARGLNRFTGVASEAPALVALEHSTIRWLCTQFGLPTTAGGVITTGGSLASLTALVAARHALLGDRISSGTLYATAHTHPSLAKAAHIAGLPPGNVRLVPTTPDLKMDVHEAESMIRRDRADGRHPFLIIANAGTTDTGTVDPLADIADLAAKHGLWCHVDAAYGGFFQLTERGKLLFEGIERADSIVVDPHKGLSLPYGKAVLLVARTAALRAAYSLTSPYLPEPSRDPLIPDYSELGMELTREYRGLGLWLPLHVHGVAAFQAALNEKLDLARVIHDDLAADPRLELPWTPELSTVAFRLRAGDTRRFLDRLHATSPVRLSATRIEGRDLVRLCVLSHRTHREHVRDALDAIHGALQSAG